MSLVVGGVISAVLASPAAAVIAPQVYYRETFPAPGDTNTVSTARYTNAIDAGWAAERRGGISVNELSIFNGTGSTPAQPAVNSDPDPATFGDSFLFWSPQTHNVLIYTNEFQFNVAELTRVTWETRNNTQRDLMRLAVQVDGDWYVSDQTATHTTSNAIWQQSADFTVASLTFGTYDRTRPAGQRFSGTGLSLPDIGTVTGFGLYIDAQVTGNMRFDNYTIYGTPPVPEPATAAMGLLSLVGLTFTLRRRRG
jgi:hypothetical protein